MKKTTTLILLILTLTLLTGCADNVTFEQASKIDPVGFWYGLWHGITFGIAFIGSLFSDNIAVYAIYNDGGWYNFGFWLGIVGLISSRRKR